MSSSRDRELQRNGQDEEVPAEKFRNDGRGNGRKLALVIVILVILTAIAALLTVSVSVRPVAPGGALPYTTTYAVTFPEGETVTLGNSRILVLTFQEELISDIDGDRQKLVVGEERVIAERGALITTLGMIVLLDTDFRINLKYKGARDNLAYFDMAVHTSRQVPDILLRMLLPAEIHAQPI